MLKFRNSVRFAVGAGLLLVAAMFLTEVFARTNGSPARRTGAPGESTCATSSCHPGTLNSGPGTLSITSDATSNIYMPGQTYNFTVTLAENGITKFGFQTIGGYSAATNATTGNLAVTNSGETKLVSSSGRTYITHISGGTQGTAGSRTWDFQWTAPPTDEGPITFYTTGNATNSNNSGSGDKIYQTELTLNPVPVGTEEVVDQMNALKAFPSHVNDQIHIQMENAHFSTLNIRFINLNGQEVKQHTQHVAGYQLRETLDVATLKAGIYLMVVEAEGFRESVKFIKL